MTAIELLHADPELGAALHRRRRQWREADGTARLWSRDGSLWTGSGEENRLGWLDVDRLGSVTLLNDGGERVETAAADLAKRLAGPPFERCLLLGMGGSALGADLLWRALGRHAGGAFIVLDTTDPREIGSALDGVEPAALRVVAASKSGGTIETRLAFELLLDRLGDAAAARTLAITDPGSALEERARAAGATIAFGHADIGGRFSALSAFGVVPAAVAGIDPGPLLASARSMAAACRRGGTDMETNPGVELGLLLAAAHDAGRDKLHLHAPGAAAAMAAWVEQLIAESLGKGDVLLLPVDTGGLPAEPRPDRLDIVLGSEAGNGESAPPRPDGPVARIAAELAEALGGDGGPATPPQGGPVVRIAARLPEDIGGEFFRWQFGAAVAGALLGVNPFDQPDVESSKVVTRRYVERMKVGSAPEPGGVVRLSEVSALGLAQLLGTHLATLPERGYAVISAYLERSSRNRDLLQALLRRVADVTGGASVLGFGPSFLHSTGQAHKGAPNRGLFLQITAEPPAADIPAPGEGLTFGQVQLAQAWGDREVLVERDRRVLAVHIDGDVEQGLRRLVEAAGQELAP